MSDYAHRKRLELIPLPTPRRVAKALTIVRGRSAAYADARCEARRERERGHRTQARYWSRVARDIRVPDDRQGQDALRLALLIAGLAIGALGYSAVAQTALQTST